MDRGAWRTTVHGVTKSRMNRTEQLNTAQHSKGRNYYYAPPSFNFGFTGSSLQHTSSLVVIAAHRLSCPATCGISVPHPTRNQTCVPCIGRWILNHWTTREVPYCPIFKWQTLRDWLICKGQQSVKKGKIQTQVCVAQNFLLLPVPQEHGMCAYV